MAGGDFLEHFLDAAERQPVRGMTKMLAHGLFAERAFRAKIADLERILLRQAGGHDFAEQPHHLGIRQRAVVAIHHHAQHVRLAFGTVIVDCRKPLALHLGHFPGPVGTLGDQLLDLPVDAVDAVPHLHQR
jgi:hypothetical protein